MIYQKKDIILVIVLLIIIVLNSYAQEDECCMRIVSFHFFKGEFSNPEKNAFDIFTKNREALHNCKFPIYIDMAGQIVAEKYGNLNDNKKTIEIRRNDNIDYEFQIKKSISKSKNNDTVFNLNIDFVDLQHNAIIQNESTTWNKTFNLGNEGNIINEIIQKFQNLTEIIYNYEGKPQSCDIDIGGDFVLADETRTIKIDNLLDHNGNASKPWQIIYAKANKGKILNGIEKVEGYKKFEVGKDGSVVIQYKAPSSCENLTENIKIFNSCDMSLTSWFGPKKEIKNQEFDIVCLEVDYDISYYCHYTNDGITRVKGGVEGVQFSMINNELIGEGKIITKTKTGIWGTMIGGAKIKNKTYLKLTGQIIELEKTNLIKFTEEMRCWPGISSHAFLYFMFVPIFYYPVRGDKTPRYKEFTIPLKDGFEYEYKTPCKPDYCPPINTKVTLHTSK